MSFGHSRFTALAAAPLLIGLSGCGPGAEPPAQAAVKSTEDTWQGVAVDDRQAIIVDAATRQAVLAEMRTMLQAVQGVVGGAAAWDTAAIRNAARSGGIAAASETDPNVEAQLGEEFVQLGMRTHLAFDSLANDVAIGKSHDAVLRRLATVMGNCVGCHNQWRLTVRE